jgi:methyl-accepting chemotaxis protein
MSISIRAQLTFGIGIIILLISGIAFMSYVSVEYFQVNFQNMIEEVNHIRELSLGIENNFFLARREEILFMDEWRTIGFEAASAEHVASFNDYLTKSSLLLDDMERLVSDSDDATLRSLTEEIDAIRPLLESYASSFQTSVGYIEERSSVGGLEYELLNTSTQLESAVGPLANPGLSQLIMQIQLEEQSYLVTGSSEHHANIQLLVILFTSFAERELERDPVYDSISMSKTELVDAANNYSLLFDQMTNMDDAIGANTTLSQEVTIDIEEITDNISRKSELGLSNSNARLDQVNNQTKMSLISIVAALILVMTFVVIWWGQRMIRALGSLSYSAKQIGEGNLAERVTVSGGKELVILGEAFNRMREDIGAMMAVEHANRERLEDTVAEYTEFAEAVANGNLTARLNVDEYGDGEDADDDLRLLGNNLNIMVEGLSDLVRRVQETAINISGSSEQISNATNQSEESIQQVAATIQQITEGAAQQTEDVNKSIVTVEQLAQAIEGVAKGAQEQAASIGQSVELTSWISDATHQVAANAQTGSSSAIQTSVTAHNGAETVRKTLQGMENIRQKVELSAQKVREMGQRSEHIGAIVETIDNIASQTNLLALNATIEAARAGEHGRGFAVVADEVRKLAEKSAQSTKGISDLIKDIQETIAEAIKAMDEGADEVEVGVAQAGESGQALDEVLVAIEVVNQQMGEISAASQQMNSSVNEMVDTMDSVSAIVEENTASTEEMAASADEVSRAFENIASISEENSAATQEVSATTEEVTAQAREVSISAQELREMAQVLQDAVAQFDLHEFQEAVFSDPT